MKQGWPGAPFSQVGLMALILAALAGVFSFFVYLRKSRSRQTANQLDELKDFLPESKYSIFDNQTIHYVQAGTGPDLVLLHGIGASVYIWRFLFPLLESKYRVTAIDLPGFGQSSKDRLADYGLDSQASRVAAMLTGIGIERAILVGSSMGGAIALWLGKTRPERFDRVITLAPATDHRLVPAAATWLSGFLPMFGRALNRHTMKMILKRVLARAERIDATVVNAYLKPFLEDGSSFHTFKAATTLLADRRLPYQLEGIEARVLIIYGQKDRMVPMASIVKLKSLLPHAQLLLHPQAGHHIMEDEPTWTAESILAFLSNSSPSI